MASVLDLIKHYQHAIEKYCNDEQKILKCIDKLFHLSVTVQHLQETGVGRTVNALRKEPGDVGQAARALVYKWKLMVASEESDQETDNNETSKYNGHDDGNSNGNHKSKTKQEKYETEAKQEDKSHRHMNGDHNRNKRKYHSSEEDEPDGKKSKHSQNKENSYKIKTEPKSDKSESESEESSESGSDSDTSNSTDTEKVEYKKIKEEKIDQYKSPPSKDSSSHSHRNKSSSGSDKDKLLEKHYKYSTESSKHSSSKDRSQTSYRHSSKETKERDQIKEKKERSFEKDRLQKETPSEKEKPKESSSKHSKSNNHKDEKDKSSKSKLHEKERLSEKEKRPDKDKKHSESTKHNPDKHKSSEEKREKSTSKSDKHSEKDKHRSSKEKHESKEKNKDRHQEKSKDKSSSSKDRDHKDKRSSSSDVTKDRKKSKSDKSDSSRSDCSRKDKHKSSSKNNDIPKKKIDESNGDSDGIGCESGASFAEALGMVSPVKSKKKQIKETHSPSSFNGDLSPASLLAPDAKLAPLPNIEISALPEISPNYKPRPPPKFLPHFDDMDLSTVMSSKNQRTKVYSGNKVIGKIPSLYEMCVQVLQEHIDALEYTGGVPYEILKPVVDRATPQQLFMLEHFNPYLMEDTDHLWQKFCEKHFRNKKRMEMETWREMYMRCQEEQEIKLKSLTENIKIAQEAKKAPIKQTKMAYVDTVVKPPRSVARKQAQHGTAFAATASPAARVAALATAPNVLKGGRPTPVTTLSPFVKPKKAPLMQKALQFMRGRKR
ncbi:transcription elongation factor B polypeptide 3 [Pieris brassicae]|uniref:transcription elongation factor B polypeptide 3 n=1 Tax=Pieris brassicae TaxID=7116 RepID=UPI001E65E5D4|nr:transcription elongation factor B polypeptide 3 [Pieris brassicae]